MAIFATGCQPAVHPTVQASDPKITHANGMLFYAGNTFTGNLLTRSSDGDTLQFEKYENGRLEGESRRWYDNGALSEIREYHEGKKTGIHQGFWPDHSKRFLYHFLNDLAEGNQKDWTDKGLLWRDFNYKNGQEDGPQKMWWENGSIRMNYTVIKGRRFGLQGVKNCDTVSENDINISDKGNE